MAVINLEYIETHFGDDPEFIQEVLEMFQSSVPGKLKKIKEQIIGEQWEDIYQTAHSMKASVKMLGMKPLFEVVSQIEQVSKSESKENLTALAAQAESLVDQAELEIKEVLKERKG